MAGALIRVSFLRLFRLFTIIGSGRKIDGRQGAFTRDERMVVSVRFGRWHRQTQWEFWQW
jgi:hypothetical protein